MDPNPLCKSKRFSIGSRRAQHRTKRFLVVGLAAIIRFAYLLTWTATMGRGSPSEDVTGEIVGAQTRRYHVTSNTSFQGDKR